LPSFVRSLPRCYDLIRLLIRVHARRSAIAFPSRPGTSPGTDETSQVPRKELLHVHKVSDCARFFPCKPFAMGRCCLLFNGTRSAPRNSTRFAAQYSARGLPCERFTAALASRTSCITRGRGSWLDLPRGGLAPPILCQLVLAHSVLGQSRFGRRLPMPASLRFRTLSANGAMSHQRMLSCLGETTQISRRRCMQAGR
jgi:hypothetical protein